MNTKIIISIASERAIIGEMIVLWGINCVHLLVTLFFLNKTMVN